MKASILIISLALLTAPALAEECTPAATQRLGELLSRVTDASKTVDGYKKKYKTDSAAKSDLYMFCLSGETRRDFASVFKEAAPAVNNLEEFGKAQTGACKDSALRASQDLENNVRQIMARFEECKKNQN